MAFHHSDIRIILAELSRESAVVLAPCVSTVPDFKLEYIIHISIADRMQEVLAKHTRVIYNFGQIQGYF